MFIDATEIVVILQLRLSVVRLVRMCRPVSSWIYRQLENDFQKGGRSTWTDTFGSTYIYIGGPQVLNPSLCTLLHYPLFDYNNTSENPPSANAATPPSKSRGVKLFTETPLPLPAVLSIPLRDIRGPCLSQTRNIVSCTDQVMMGSSCLTELKLWTWCGIQGGLHQQTHLASEGRALRAIWEIKRTAIYILMKPSLWGKKWRKYPLRQEFGWRWRQMSLYAIWILLSITILYSTIC